MSGRQPVPLGVDRKEEGDGVVRAGAREARDRGRKSLEIEVVHRGHAPCESGADVAVHLRPALDDGPPDDALQPVQREVSRNVANLPDAPRGKAGAKIRRQPREFVEAVIGHGQIARAMGEVRARVRREAVLARRDVRGRGFGEHRLQVAHLGAHGLEPCIRLVGHGVQTEQRVEVQPLAVVDVVAVEREHARLAHVQPGAAQDPELDSRVDNEHLLQPRRRLDLDQAPAGAGQALEHVGAHQHPLVHEGGLEQRRRCARVKDGARLVERLADVAMIVRHQVAARVAPARQFAHFLAGVEDCLERLVGGGRKVAVVAVVPEPEMALRARDEARLREAGPAPSCHRGRTSAGFPQLRLSGACRLDARDGRDGHDSWLHAVIGKRSPLDCPWSLGGSDPVTVPLRGSTCHGVCAGRGREEPPVARDASGSDARTSHAPAPAFEE